MPSRRSAVAVGLLAALGWFAVAMLQTFAGPGDDKKQPPDTASQKILKAESNMVLVDAVVTDKHGNYLHDLKQGDFHVFEDGKEQSIVSFSLEAQNRAGENAKPASSQRRRLLVIFFDVSRLQVDQQALERQEADKFIDAVDLSTHLVAVMDYLGVLKLTQDFTADRELLKKAVNRPLTSPSEWTDPASLIPAKPGAAMPADPGIQMSLQRERMRALRALARFLGTVPGRKTVIYMTPEIPLIPELQTYFQEAVTALNKANVGVYTIGALGSIIPDTAQAAVGNYRRNVLNSPATPMYPPGARELSAHTGAFAFSSNNDIHGAMEKALSDVDEAYILGYMQPEHAHNGSSHKIRVTVDRRGAEIRARDSYVDTRSPDLLATEEEGRQLEALEANIKPGDIPITLTKPYFYVKPDLARVNLTLSIPGSEIEYKKEGDRFVAHLSVLAIAHRDDGSVATRFSDTMALEYEKDEKPEAVKHPYYYHNSFRIPPGEYILKLVLTAGGEKFGKYVVPLIVDPFSGKQLTLSGPAFGDALVPDALDSAQADPDKIEGNVPLTALGIELVPSSSNHLKKDKPAPAYLEIYDPLLASGAVQIGFLYDITDLKTNQKVHSSNTIPVGRYIRPGNSLVPVIFNLPTAQLPAGSYSIQVRARDSAGNVSETRTGYFSVEE